MCQPSPIDILAPTGAERQDRALLEDIRKYLGREEIVNTIMLAGLMAREGFDPAHPVLAARVGDDLATVATLTPGFLMLLSHVERPDAVPALAGAAAARDLVLPGVMGPADGTLAFAEAWAAQTGGTYRPGMAQRILVARSVQPPSSVAGTWRHLESDDRSLLLSWFTAFNAETDGLPANEARQRG